MHCYPQVIALVSRNNSWCLFNTRATGKIRMLEFLMAMCIQTPGAYVFILKFTIASKLNRVTPKYMSPYRLISGMMLNIYCISVLVDCI